MTSDEETAALAFLSQEAINSAPTFFVDGHIGIATNNGVARISFVDTIFNVGEGAQTPGLRPVVNILVPEASLLAFAHEMVSRAAALAATEKE